MTNEAIGVPRPRGDRLPSSKVGPVMTVWLAVVSICYLAAVAMNFAGVRDRFQRDDTPYTLLELVAGTIDAERPVLPAPHQIVAELANSVVAYPPTSNRSLVYHGWVTMSA